MAEDGTYRAVFLRMHPTGKAVLSLSEASQGEEAKLAGIAAEELGIPPEDIKVVHEDTDRFGEGNSFSNRPSDVVGENVAITARKLRDKAQIVAGSMLGTSPDSLPSTTATGRRGAVPRGSGSRRSRSTPSAASSFRMGSRALWTPRRPTGSGPCRRPDRPRPTGAREYPCSEGFQMPAGDGEGAMQAPVRGGHRRAGAEPDQRQGRRLGDRAPGRRDRGVRRGHLRGGVGPPLLAACDGERRAPAAAHPARRGRGGTRGRGGLRDGQEPLPERRRARGLPRAAPAGADDAGSSARRRSRSRWPTWRGGWDMRSSPGRRSWPDPARTTPR